MDLELYDLAFAFKKTKLWKELWDSQLFAVAHADGQTGYCCVMGRAGRHLALAVYPGVEGLASYRMMSSSAEDDDLSPFHMKELAMSQDCLMLSFQNKAELEEDEQAELSAYCAQRGITLRGQNACPQFERFRPRHHPWTLDDEKDIRHLKEALRAAQDVSRRLKKEDPEILGFTEGPPYDRDIPLLTQKGDQWIWSAHSLPAPILKSHPAMDALDDLTLARLNKIKKKAGVWSAHVFMHGEPLTEETVGGKAAKKPKKAPIYPMMLLVVDNQDGLVLTFEMTPQVEDYAAPFKKSLVDLMLKQGRPALLEVKDERSLALLSPLCRQLNIPLKREDDIPALDEALDDLYEQFGGDAGLDGPGGEERMEEMLSFLEDLPSLTDVPEDMLAMLIQMLPAGMFSKGLQDRVKAEAKRRGM